MIPIRHQSNIIYPEVKLLLLKCVLRILFPKIRIKVKAALLIFLFLFTNRINFAQTEIAGIVTDENDTSLPGANIFLEGTYDGASSEQDGTFSFTTDEKGDAVLVVSFIGFKTFQKELELSGESINLTIVLEEESPELGDIVVSAGAFEASDEKKAVILSPLDVTLTGVTADIYAAMQTLPGTQAVGESEGLFVRGGSAAETKTIIDEMIVQNPFYSSVPDLPSRGRFSPFLFKGTIFSTGGYSAQYGQALSSVLILNTQDLPDETLSAINLMILGLGGAHTQRWEKSSISAEAGYYNLAPYFNVQKQRTDWEKAPESFEGSVNFRHKPTETGIIKSYLSYGFSNLSLFLPNLDNPPNKDFYKKNDDNFFYNGSYRDIIFNDWNLFTGYSFSVDTENIEFDNDDINRKETLNAGKLFLSKNLSRRAVITFGGEIRNVTYDNEFNEIDLREKEFYSAGFLESDLLISSKIAAKVGLRAEHSAIIDESNIAPRIAFAYKLGKNDQLNFAYGKFYQTPRQDFLFQYKDFEFERATHYIANYQYIGKYRTFRIEGYYKDYDNLAKGTVFTYPYFDLPIVPFGSGGFGYAKGIDVFWRDKKSIKYTDYWISYSYLDTERKYGNYPEPAFPTFAAPHTFSLVLKHWLPSITTNIGITYTFASGRPYFNPNNKEFLGDRAKVYNNLSMNISYITNFFGNFTVLFMSLDNLLGIDHIYNYRYSSDGRVKVPVKAAALRSAFIGLFISIGGSSF